MMRKHSLSTGRCLLACCLLLVSLLTTSCRKEWSTLSILAEAEAPGSDEKTFLSYEHLVYWQVGDRIDAQIDGGSNVTLQYNGVEGTPKALFTLTDGQTNRFVVGSSSTFYALFPHNDTNTLGEGNMQVVFPADQGYADDKTFGRAACPMVAYGGHREMSVDSIVRLTFHNLCGLVRIQLRNTSTEKTLESITFTSNDADKPLSGLFKVNDYTTYAPYVTAVSGRTSASTAINLTSANLTLGNELRTFYVVLPATNSTTEYHLTMQVKATSGGTDYYFTKSLTVPIRRNGITKMRAMEIYNWSQSSGTNGDANVSISGNGTSDRPFLVYSVDDLVKVRDAFKNSSSINGKSVSDGGLFFRLMRSDLVLTDDNWTEGIPNFKGSFVFGGNQVNSPGITNNSSHPVFQSVDATGSVRNLAVRGGRTWSTEEDVSYSPLCHINNGSIYSCRVVSATYSMSYSGSGSVGMGGICVVNNGTLSGCGCRATLMAPNVGGICYQNNGTVKGCYVSSPMRTYTSSSQAVRVGGICYENGSAGTVQDCYFAANINALRPTEWGGLVYLNSGTVQHSYVDASGIIQSTASIGGIVHTMTGGVVDDCWNDADLMNVQNSSTYTSGGLGGIVFSLSGGEVRNCLRYRPGGSFTCVGGGVAGGFVARMTGGAVRNSAFYGDLTQTISSKGAFVGLFTAGTIENAYAYQSLGSTLVFYHQAATSGTTFSDCFGQTTQTGVTVPANYAALFTSLNAHNWSENSNYNSWTAVNDAPPVLQ